VKELLTRTIAGAALVLIVIASILFSEYSFLALFLVITFIAQKEFCNIAGKPTGSGQIMLAISSLGTLVITFLTGYGLIPLHCLAFIPVLLVLNFSVILFHSGSNMTEELGKSSLFYLWITIPQALFILSGRITGDGIYTPMIPLSIIVMIWIFDTFAYLTGMISGGRHKMYPSLSPKKSWEGFAGGTIFTIVLAALAGPLTGFLNPVHWILTALVVSLTATLGDFFESRFKREHHVKDSGKIIPGHGGILDRFDSLFFTAPVIYALFLIFRL